MKLFKMKNWVLHVEEEAWGISAFKKILERDDSKEKENALKDMLFIYYFCDIKSDYIILPEKERCESIKSEVGLLDDWVMDDTIKEGVRIYNEYSETTIQRLYKKSLKSAEDIGNYLENTDILLAERDDRGKPVTDISKITASLQRIPKLMADLKAAYKEVVQEQDELEGKKKGSRSMNTFEDGFKIE